MGRKRKPFTPTKANAAFGAVGTSLRGVRSTGHHHANLGNERQRLDVSKALVPFINFLADKFGVTQQKIVNDVLTLFCHLHLPEDDPYGKEFRKRGYDLPDVNEPYPEYINLLGYAHTDAPAPALSESAPPVVEEIVEPVVAPLPDVPQETFVRSAFDEPHPTLYGHGSAAQAVAQGRSLGADGRIGSDDDGDCFYTFQAVGGVARKCGLVMGHGGPHQEGIR